MVTKTKSGRGKARSGIESITTCLAFKDRAEEAVRFYVSIFPNSRIVSLSWSKGNSPIPKGKLMGATFRLPTAPADEDEFRAWTLRTKTTVWAAMMDGTALERLERPERLALVVGNEGAGVRPAVAELARTQVAIPLARGAESLNVSVAAGIILYEIQRGA